MTSGGKREKAGRPSLGETEAILVRMPPALKKALTEQAKAEAKSTNALIVEILGEIPQPKEA